MYQGTTPKREYPVTMVCVAGSGKKGDEMWGGGDHDKLDGSIVPELTVRYTHRS